MTSAVASPEVAQVLGGDFKRATRTTGQRCTGVGQQPFDTVFWNRGLCPGCMLNQRTTQDGLMMSHYVIRVRGEEEAAENTTESAPLATVTAISARLQDAITGLDTPAEPSTVGEFVKAITALSGALATAIARITELEQSPPPPATPASNEIVEQWQADWLELNQLLAYYAIERGWCPEFESIISGWNRTRFGQGYLLSRRELSATVRERNSRISRRQQSANQRLMQQRRDVALEHYRALARSRTR